MKHLMHTRYRTIKPKILPQILFSQIQIPALSRGARFLFFKREENIGDAYWNRQAQLPQSTGLLKQHVEYVPEIPQSGMPSAHEVHHYLGRNDDREGAQVMDTRSIGLADDRGVPRVMDTQSIESAYDRYLQSLVITETDTAPTFCRGPRAGGGGIPSIPVRDPLPSARGPELAPNGRRRPRETLTLPPGASNTLYIKGLPSDSSRREVAHIFRHFVGYKEVRLVRRDSKHHAGDPLILGFVDFVDPACASTALSALQGYKMDEHDHDSAYLRMQFSKFTGPRFGSLGSTRGKR